MKAPRWWIFAMVGVFVFALAVRTVNVTVWYPSCDLDIIEHVESGTRDKYPECPEGEFRIWGDAGYSYLQGYLLANGHGFSDGATWFATGGTRIVDSAGDPPLYAMWSAALFKVGARSGEAQRLANGVLGAVGVVLIAMVAARVAGRRAGIVAGVIGAAYPLLWINDGMMLSEGMYVVAVAGVLLAAYAFWDRPSMARAAGLGATIGLATLVRGEALVMLFVLVVPLLLRLRQWSWRQRGAAALAAGITAGALIAPWVLYNMSRFKASATLTSQTGAVLSAGSCDVAFYGEALGYYAADCYGDYIRKGYPVGDPRMPGCTAEAAATIDLMYPEGVEKPSDACYPDPEVFDEAERDKVITEFGTRYIKENKGRLPVVALARIGRMFDLYNPDIGGDLEPLGDNVFKNWYVEGRGKRASELGFVMYWVLVPFAVGGVVALKRRRIPLSPLLGLPAVIALTAAIAMGITRYRVPVDLVLVILAAVAVDALLRRRWPVAPEDDATVRPIDPRSGPRSADPEEGTATLTDTSRPDAVPAAAPSR